MRGWLSGVVLTVFWLPSLLIGQGTQSQVRFTFERAITGVMVPRYTILLRADGGGEYSAETILAPSTERQAVTRPVAFSPATVSSAMEALRLIRSSGVPCDAKLKNIADTGTKTLAYRDAEGEGTCTYNYSDNKGVKQLTEMFQGIEVTLEEGRALDFKHRFDRLGLDAEISNLMAAVDGGRAVELGNIAPTLRSIAGDTELIQRVRLRAAKLLERAQAGS